MLIAWGRWSESVWFPLEITFAMFRFGITQPRCLSSPESRVSMYPDIATSHFYTYQEKSTFATLAAISPDFQITKILFIIKNFIETISTSF